MINCHEKAEEDCEKLTVTSAALPIPDQHEFQKQIPKAEIVNTEQFQNLFSPANIERKEHPPNVRVHYLTRPPMYDY